MSKKLIGIAVAVGLGFGLLPASPAQAAFSAQYVGFNDYAMFCEVNQTATIGLGGWCFDNVPAGPRLVTVEDASGLPVGVWVRGPNEGSGQGFCGSGTYNHPGGLMVVFVDGPLFSIDDCAGTVPFSPVGTVGNIFVN